LTPLGESGGPVELEMVSAVEVAFLVEDPMEMEPAPLLEWWRASLRGDQHVVT